MHGSTRCFLHSLLLSHSLGIPNRRVSFSRLASLPRITVLAVSIVFTVILALTVSPSPLFAVNGYMEEVDGQTVLHVWGSHYEMGYANGYLNGAGIMEMLEDYTVDYFMTPLWYMYVRTVAQEILDCPERLEEEFDGIVDGMSDSGVDIYIDSLGRDADALDIKILNTGPESNVPIACSSHSGWGDATADSPDLEGGLVICRDMDWSPDPYGILYRNAMITTFDSSLPDEQRWVSIAYSGTIGCLSGFNESGVGAFLNMGNHVSDGLVNARYSVVPELLALRTGVEQDDLDGDGSCTLKDVYRAVNTNPRAGSYCIHVVAPWLTSELPVPAVVIEAHHSAGVMPRFSHHDEKLAPWFLAVTNHHRRLFPEILCLRYREIRQRLREDYRLSCREAWDIEAGVASSTMQCMLFRPDHMDIWVSFADSESEAPFIQPTHYGMEDLFD